MKIRVLQPWKLPGILFHNPPNSVTMAWMAYFFGVILFLIPLVYPFGNLGYESAKVFSFLSLVSVGAFIWLFLGKRNDFGQLLKIAGVFVLALLAGSLLGTDLFSSITGKNPYFQGIVLYSYLWVFAFLASVWVKKTKFWIYCLFASSLVIALWALKDWVVLNLLKGYAPTYAGRVVSSFGQPNFYSGYLLMTVPLIFSLKKAWVWPGVFLIALAILASASRASILIGVLMCLGFLIYRFRNLRKIAVSFSLISILGIFFVSFVLFKKEIEVPGNSGWLVLNSPEKREYIWPVMGELILKRPVLGYGLENIDTAYAEFFRLKNYNSLRDKPAYYSLRNLVVDRAHSYPLDILMYSGILGFLAWAFLVYKMFKTPKPAVKVFLAVYLIWVLVQVQSVAHLMLFYFVLGISENDID